MNTETTTITGEAVLKVWSPLTPQNLTLAVAVSVNGIQEVVKLTSDTILEMLKASRFDLVPKRKWRHIRLNPCLEHYIEQARNAPDRADYAVEVWGVDDVLQQAEEDGEKLTREQAQGVLNYVEHKHDCNQGINWDVISCWIAEVKRRDAEEAEEALMLACPYHQGVQDSVDQCKLNENRPCLIATGDKCDNTE